MMMDWAHGGRRSLAPTTDIEQATIKQIQKINIHKCNLFPGASGPAGRKEQ